MDVCMNIAFTWVIISNTNGICTYWLSLGSKMSHIPLSMPKHQSYILRDHWYILYQPHSQQLLLLKMQKVHSGVKSTAGIFKKEQLDH